MRQGCIDCVIKHLGTAAVYDDERLMGYPQYYGREVGELVHASLEIMAIHMRLALVIREHRINLQNDDTYRIPFDDLMHLCDSMRSMDHGVLDSVVIPEACCRGIRKDNAGNLIFSMDTRPAEEYDDSDGGDAIG